MTAAVALLAIALLYRLTPTLAPDFTAPYLIALFTAWLVLEIHLWRHKMLARAALAALLLLFLGLRWASTSPVINADAYYRLLGKETAADFSSVLPPIDIEQAPLVSVDMARSAMQKRLSERQALGSQVEIADPVRQLVNGKLVWVAFLEHRGFFKWLEQRATPGYVVVSAHDPADVRLVTELEGKPLRMTYLETAWFGDQVERHAWRSGLFTTGLTDFTPEIDDAGRPYYVATTFRHAIGFGGSEATGVAVIDVQTGEVKTYAIDAAPAWIERIQPEAFMREQMDDRGEFVHGWLNLSDRDRTRLADELDLVYGTDGRAYWVGGMTSKGNNTGLSGFFFVDSRNKAVRSFKVSAVSQGTAMHAVEHVNPEKRYAATNPLPFKVAGAPTYVMALRDAQGVSRAYGMVDMRNHQVIAVADTLAATLRSFQSRRSAERTQAGIGVAATMETVEGKVVRISSEYRNNQTMYYLIIAPNDPARRGGIIYTGASDLSEELVLTRPGDTVSLGFSNTGTRIMGLSKFRNLDLPSAPPGS